MNEIIIDFTDAGVEAMHFDRFSLGFLGKMQISRASEIFFNHDNQDWDIKLPGQDRPFKAATGFSCYENARDFEIEWLQTCRKFGINPTSERGEQICEAIRANE